jgi:hypothetical protein
MSGVLGWHPKFTLPIKPLTDAIVTLKFADSPAFTVALPGNGDGVVSGAIVLLRKLQ